MVYSENFMILLASRLDAVVYSLGLARTSSRRQLVNHGHIEVDGGHPILLIKTWSSDYSS